MSALPGPKHARLVHHNLRPWEVKVGSGMLPGPKHVGLGCDSLSSWEVKVGLGALLEPKHAELRHIRGKKWVQTCCLDPGMLGSGRTLESGHMRLGRRSPSPWWCQVYHAHTRCTPCMGSGFLLKLMLSRELGSSDHTRAHSTFHGPLLYFELEIPSSSLKGVLDRPILRDFSGLFWEGGVWVHFTCTTINYNSLLSKFQAFWIIVTEKINCIKITSKVGQEALPTRSLKASTSNYLFHAK